jgi:RHS repeat-associated protein
MSLLRISLCCLPAIWTATQGSNVASAANVVVKITGTTAPGTSDKGIFVPGSTSETDISGQDFTLIFTFDDSKGQDTVYYSYPGGPPDKSDYTGTGSSSPGNAVLQIGAKSYPYPQSTSSEATRWAGGKIYGGTNFNVYVADSVNDSEVNALYYPQGSLVLSYNWESSFTDANVTCCVYSFNISVKTDTGYNSAGGSLNPTAITVVGPGWADALSKLLGAGETAGSCLCGDPINVGTGNVFEQTADYSTVGQNKLQFTRYYNSGAPESTLAHALGKNWRSNYDRYIEIISPTTIYAERADGQEIVFNLSGTNWASDTDVDVHISGTGSTWTLIDVDDTIESYAQGPGNTAYLQSIQARNGYKLTLQYGLTNEVESVTDSYNRTLALNYQNNLLQSVTTPDGLVLTYSFSSSGTSAGVLDRLASVAYSTAPQTRQSYLYQNASLPFALTGIVDEDGDRFATWSYDNIGRALSSQHGLGADLTSISYDAATGNRTLTNALGQQEIYQFSILQNVPKVTEIDRLATPTTTAASRKFTYDSNGYLASQTDWNGNLTTYVNDAHGQPTAINEAVGTVQARTTNITYLSHFHLPSQIVTAGLTTDFSYDGSGNLLMKTLTDTTTTAVPYLTNGTSRSWTFTWLNSLLASTKGPRADVSELTSFTYDSSGTLTKITNALGQVTEISAHLPGGLPLMVVDPNQVTTNLIYDARQRMLSATLSTPAGPLATNYSYDAAGNLVKTTLPDGSALTNTYDTAHRLTDVTDLFKQRIVYTLDALGDRTKTVIANSSGVTQRIHSQTFDSLGHVLQDIGGVGQTIKYTYDPNGNALTITDPLSHLTQQSFDALNRVIQVVDAGTGITKVTYDPHDRPVTVLDPNGGSTTYVYDGFGDVIERTSPDTGKTVYHYDLAGNLIQSVDATGSTANFTYDALDRVLTTKYPADLSENIAYIYDESGRGFGIGRLTSVTDAVGSLSRSYDERGSILSERRVHGTATLLTSYAYDKASRVSSITYPSGWSTLYTRDVMGRITAINANSPSGVSQSVVSGVSYQPYGPVNALTYGNGVAEAHTFDLDYRLTNLTSSGKAALQNLTYSYDAANNVSSIADGVTAANSQGFGYDALDRLTSAKGGYGSLGYTYSSIGNRLTQTSSGATTSYVYAPHSNQLTQVKTGTATQTVGNTSTGSVNSFSPPFGQVSSLTYNQAGRLASTGGSGGKITQYTYDAFGQRLLKVGSATSTSLFQYDSGGHLIQEADGQGNTRVDYIYLSDRPVATVQPTNNKVYFLQNDRLGTPEMATDETQSIIWTTTYQPFGQISATPTLLVQDLRFPGQESDLETGLYHNGFRDYVPGLGMYLESDPIGLLGGMNTYGYVRANPLNGIDPKGLDTYIVNRDLSLFGHSSEPQWDWFTHTFVVVTNPDGSVLATYSWGNDANLVGWNLDQPLDITTAEQALSSGEAQRVGGPDLDPFVGEAYIELSNPLLNHQNWYLTNNCKTEASKLLSTAQYLESLYKMAHPLSGSVSQMSPWTPLMTPWQ